MEQSSIGILHETQEDGIEHSYIRSDVPPQPETTRWNPALASPEGVLAEVSGTKEQKIQPRANLVKNFLAFIPLLITLVLWKPEASYLIPFVPAPQ